jgi:hypothetical protein
MSKNFQRSGLELAYELLRTTHRRFEMIIYEIHPTRNRHIWNLSIGYELLTQLAIRQRIFLDILNSDFRWRQRKHEEMPNVQLAVRKEPSKAAEYHEDANVCVTLIVR